MTTSSLATPVFSALMIDKELGLVLVRTRNQDCFFGNDLVSEQCREDAELRQRREEVAEAIGERELGVKQVVEMKLLVLKKILPGKGAVDLIGLLVMVRNCAKLALAGQLNGIIDRPSFN